jgi:hypothetical protein
VLPLPQHCFPSSIDFSDAKTRNPDKDVAKMYLNVEPPILTCRTMRSHLLFEVAEEGRALLEAV